jgi:hypothetical protein
LYFIYLDNAIKSYTIFKSKKFGVKNEYWKCKAEPKAIVCPPSREAVAIAEKIGTVTGMALVGTWCYYAVSLEKTGIDRFASGKDLTEGDYLKNVALTFLFAVVAHLYSKDEKHS